MSNDVIKKHVSFTEIFSILNTSYYSFYQPSNLGRKRVKYLY